MDHPQVRKKQQAKQKAKEKGHVYSKKHVRLLESIITSKSKDNGKTNGNHP